MKIIKKIAQGLLFIIVAFVLFYFWGSSSGLKQEDYSEIKLAKDSSFKNSDTLNIMTYNIGWLSGMTNNLAVERSEELYSSNLHRFTSYLNQKSIDVVAFQEIDIDANRSYNYQQIDSITYLSSYANSATAVNWDKKYVPFPGYNPKYYFGKTISAQAIVTNFKVVSNGFETLIKPINAPFYYNAFYLDRLIQKTIIDIGNSEVMLLNVHLEAFDAETRMEHIIKAKSAFEHYSKTMPTILLGDLNSPQDSLGQRNKYLEELIKLPNISMAIEDSTYFKNPKQYNTYPSANPVYKIDFIFYSNNYFEFIESDVVKDFTESSDHLPVLLKLKLKK